MAIELQRPRGISDQSRDAVSPAEGAPGPGLAPASRPERCARRGEGTRECVARVVLEERAVSYTRKDDMPAIAKAAHRTLDGLPGRAQAAQAGIRSLSQAA